MFILDWLASNTILATLLACAAATIGRITRRPQLAHALWVFVLLKLVTPPLITIPTLGWPRTVVQEESSQLESVSVLGISSAEHVGSKYPAPELGKVGPRKERPNPSHAPAPNNEDNVGGRADRYLLSATACRRLVMTIWAIGSLTWVLIAAMRVARFTRILRHAQEANDDILREVSEVAAVYGIRQIPHVLVASANLPPLVWAFGLRTTLVLPRRLLEDLDPVERAGLLAHELAHVRRYDHLVRWLQFAALAIYWWNPIVWWVRSQIQQVEEECCDGWVLWAFPHYAVSYARTLIDTVDFLSDIPNVTPNTATTFNAGKSLKRRIELIMGNQSCRPLSWPTRAILVLLALAVAPLSLLAQDEEGSGGAGPGVPSTAAIRPTHHAGSEDREQSEIPGLHVAIERGVAYLRQAQEVDGSWKEFTVQPGGMTALCTLALLKSGVPANDECVLRALRYLRGRQDSGMVYSTALQVLALSAAESSTDQATIKNALNWLQDAQIAHDAPRYMGGSWAYGKWEGQGDLSNTYFAAMALREAEGLGARVAPAVWTDLRKHLLNSQNKDGSWGYKPNLGGTGSMTCGAILCLAASVKTCSNSEEEAECSAAINAGWTWLERNFSISTNPNSDGNWYYYYLDSLARAAVITGRDWVGRHDWRREGATRVIAEQDKATGAWKGHGTVEHDPLIATSFALLFLTKVRRDH